MKTVRTTLSGAVILALCYGYIQSQLAVFTGRTREYAMAVDSPPVPTIALSVLLLAVVFAVLRDPVGKEPGS